MSMRHVTLALDASTRWMQWEKDNGDFNAEDAEEDAELRRDLRVMRARLEAVDDAADAGPQGLHIEVDQ